MISVACLAKKKSEQLNLALNHIECAYVRWSRGEGDGVLLIQRLKQKEMVEPQCICNRWWYQGVMMIER